MERDDRMNQFEALVVPFAEAKALKMKELKFFPVGASNSVKLRVARHFGATFFKYLMNDYVVWKEESAAAVQDIHNAIVDVLRMGDKTLLDLAEVVDGKLKFEDEVHA
jgi:hypothetical protein